jgi:hypothetical protein
MKQWTGDENRLENGNLGLFLANHQRKGHKLYHHWAIFEREKDDAV